MRTIAYQRRSDELNEKQPELHPDTYKRLMEFASENEGFTVSNIVNEALAQFLSVGDLARTQELVESRLEEKGVPVPKGNMRETQKKISQVAENEKAWNQVFDVHSVDEWRNDKEDFEVITLNLANGEEAQAEDTTIYLNTNFKIWDAVSEAPSFRSYVVNAAVEWWLNSSFNGSCDHILSLHQLLAAAEGEEVSEEEATEWVERRMAGIRKESDGEHHEEWEALFSEDGSPTFDISEVSVDDEVEIEEEEAREAWKHRELTQNGKNPIGVLRAVLRSKSAGVWDRESVEEVAENVFFDASDASVENYVNVVIEEVDIGVEYEWDLPDTSDFEELQDIGMKESYKSDEDMMEDLIHNFGRALDEAVGSQMAKKNRARDFAVEVIENTEYEWWSEELEEELLNEIERHREENVSDGVTGRMKRAIDSMTYISKHEL